MAKVPAIVTYAPTADKHGPNWQYEKISVTREATGKELLVRMVATGVCHTDIYISSIPDGAIGVYPKVLGHEGIGYVEAIGPEVTMAAVGDPVLLSYAYCGECDLCTTGRSSYCAEFGPLNVSGGARDVFESADSTKIQDNFFGQSSFSSLSIVNEASAVNVKGLVKDDDEMKLLAPLGCGLQTGAGAVIISGEARPSDIVVVSGIGGVGLGAVMAAKIAGCKAIIAVDRIASRLDVARSVGATHVLNTSGRESSFIEDVAALVDNQRISLAIDTTGVSAVITDMIKCLGKRGRYIQIGVSPPGTSISLSMDDFFSNGKIIEASTMGSSVARDFVPKLIQWYRDGKFPLEKLVTLFPAKDVAEALHGMEDGSVIKPVLVW